MSRARFGIDRLASGRRIGYQPARNDFPGDSRMKRLALAAVAALILQSAAARAEMLDMSTVTCAQLAEFGEDEGAWFLIWLDGWLAGQADVTTVDREEIEDQIDGIAEVCNEKPELSVMNAAKEFLGN
jgi:acid stress chaperone HdeB